MENRREIQRTRIWRDVIIVISDNASPIKSTVRDVTSKGACINVPTGPSLPSMFELSFDFCRSTRQCRVAWRNQSQIGVAFVVS